MKDKKIKDKNKKKPKRINKLRIKRRDKKTCDSLYLVLGHIMSFRSAKFILACVLLITQFILFYFDHEYHRNPDHQKTITLFIVNVLFIAVIMIFVFIAKSIGHRINQMQYAFPENDNYKKYVQAYYEWISISRKKYEGNYQISKLFYCLYRLIFVIPWIISTVIFIVYACCQCELNSHCLGIYSIVLYSISMILMGYTFFTTFAYILFLYNLSSTDNQPKLLEYNYNKRLPYDTLGFMQLKTDISIHAICYMAVSLLYSVAFPLIVTLDASFPFKQFYDNGKLFYLVIILFASLCAIGSILVFPMPMIMLKRILSLWNNKTIDTYEKEISRLHNQLDGLWLNSEKEFELTEKRIDYLERQIEYVREHNSVLKHNSAPVILTLLEFVSPILSFMVSAIS